MRSYADDLDRIEREFKQRLKKSEATFTRRYNDISSQMKSQQVCHGRLDLFDVCCKAVMRPSPYRERIISCKNDAVHLCVSPSVPFGLVSPEQKVKVIEIHDDSEITLTTEWRWVLTA